MIKKKSYLDNDYIIQSDISLHTATTSMAESENNIATSSLVEELAPL